MRILFIAGGLEGGGAERQLRLLAVGLARLGETVAIGTLSDSPRHHDGLEGVRTISLWSGKRSSPIGTALGLLRAGWQLDRELVRFRPHVTVGWLAIPIVLGAAITSRHGIPLVAAIRNAVPERLSSLPVGVQDRALGWALRRAAGIVANSREGLERYRAAGLAPAHRGVVIRNGIDTGRFRPPSEDERRDARRKLGLDPDGPVALYVGRLAPEKRIDLVLATVKSSLVNHPDLRWLLVGLEPDRLVQVHADAKGLLADSRVRCPGGLRDVRDAYRAADALVLASEWEGSPNAVAEALACGLPVASTRCGDVPELVGKDGLLVEPDPAALADAACTLAASHRPGQSREASRGLTTVGTSVEAWRAYLRGTRQAK